MHRKKDGTLDKRTHEYKLAFAVAMATITKEMNK